MIAYYIANHEDESIHPVLRGRNLPGRSQKGKRFSGWNAFGALLRCGPSFLIEALVKDLEQTGQQLLGLFLGDPELMDTTMGKEKEGSESREDYILMQELEPSPVDESPADVEKGDYFSSDHPPSPPSISRSSTLGLSGHGTIWWRTRGSSWLRSLQVSADFL